MYISGSAYPPELRSGAFFISSAGVNIAWKKSNKGVIRGDVNG